MSKAVMKRLRSSKSGSYFEFLLGNNVWIQALLLVLTLSSLWTARHLQLKTDFAELLPEKLSSVKSLQKSLDRLGGTGLVIVGVVGPNYANNRKVVEILADKFRPMVGKSLRTLEYRYNDVQKFAETYALHYLSVDQLRDIQGRLKTEIQERIDNSVGSFLGLDDSEKKSEAPPKSSGHSLKETILSAKVDPALRALLDYRDAYLSAENGKVMAMALRPMASSLSLSDSQQLTRTVQDILKEVNPQGIDPKIQTVLAGSVPQALEEFDTIRKDIVGTSVELVVLIVAVLFLFLWSVRLVALLAANLLIGVAWTFGVTQLHIGYLNTQTAFLGSLVVGTGINYGIIFLSRYIEIRRKGHTVDSAIIDAIGGTAVPTLVASVSTAVSFATLLLAANKGLSQFGFIGGVGILFCWIAAYTALPLWLHGLERIHPVRDGYKNPLAQRLKPLGERLGNGIVRHRNKWIAGLSLASVLGVFGFVHLAKAPLEYDFDNVRNKYTVQGDTEALRQQVYKAFPTSLTPSIAFADNESDARKICPAIRKIQRELPPEKNVIASCSSLYDFVPAPSSNSPERISLMKEIRDQLGHKTLKFSDEGDLARGLYDKMSFAPPRLEDIPEQMKRRFVEKNGKVGLFAYINPDSSKPLNDGRNLLSFTDSLSHLSFEVSGDSFVLADLLRGIREEGPRLTLVAFAGVIFVAIVLAGGIGAGAFMSACLVLATWWMLGAQGLLDLKYNFFNFIALPLTFGIGLDYPINIFLRCKEEGFQNYGKIFTSSGMAVFLASLTTIIGYYTLLGAASQALAGFGKLAILGEFACLVVALVGVPIGLKLMGKLKEPA